MVRDITARVRVFAWNLADPRGAVTSSVESTNQISGTGANNSVYINFDANVDTNGYGNHMHGHANGDDIHPYSIYLTPLISY